MLMIKDVPKAVQFYHEGLGLPVIHMTDRWCELDTGNGSAPLALKAVDGEAACTTGYSPFISFDVDDMDSTVARLIQMGAELDGPIKYPPHGKIAAIRSPDGHMIGLFEEAL